MGRREKTEWETTDDETGQVDSSGWSTTVTSAEGSVTTEVFHSHGADGEVFGTTEETETKDENGETVEQTRTLWNEDESGEETVTHADGSKTITKFDKDGNVVSTQHFNAEGNEVDPPKDEGNGDFWDADLIYGDHSEPFQAPDLASHMDMLMKVEESLEVHIDHFEFIL